MHWRNIAFLTLVLGLHGFIGSYCSLPFKTTVIPINLVNSVELHSDDTQVVQETKDPLQEVQALTQHLIQESLKKLT